MLANHTSRTCFADGRRARAPRRGLWGVVALCMGLALAPAAPARAATDDLALVSRADGGTGAKGDGDSFGSAMSADGRLVAFASTASNLHPDDIDGSTDVFVRDLQTDTITLVSRADGPAGAKANGPSARPVISADGRFVAFISAASNLHSDDHDGTFDVFVRDLEANTTTLVSRADGAAGAKGADDSFEPAISADGRSVAFTSWAENLHPAHNDNYRDVFVRDLEANTTTLVNRADGAAGATADEGATEPAISGDGRFVAFSTSATNLDPDDYHSLDVYVRDLEASTTTLVSRAAGASGEKGNESSSESSISADGRFVAFESGASNLHPDDPDAAGEGPGFRDLFVRDLQEHTIALVSRADGAAGAKGDGHSSQPAISADGRFVAFESGAENLHPDDGDEVLDVFVRDLEASTTTLVSRAAGPAGTTGNQDSGIPAISADGRYVAFESAASNLHPDDGDEIWDVFRRDVLGPPPSPPPGDQPPGDQPPGDQPPGDQPPGDQPPGDQPPGDQPPPDQPPGDQPPADQSSASVAVPAGTGCAGAGSSIVGTDGDDWRAGGELSDLIVGLLGNDVLRGLAGADCLYGQRGDDRLSGGPGADRLQGGHGHDRLSAGAGADLVRGGLGRDRIATGPGNDRVEARGMARDTIDCGPGRDVAIVDRLDTTRNCEQVTRP
jgi:Tol biopolymer transport system component